MKYFNFIVFYYFSIFLYIMYPPILSIGDINVDILIISIILLPLYFNPIFSILIIFISGFIVDSFVGGLIGFHSFVFLIIFYIIYKTKDLIFKNNVFFQISLIFMASLFYRLLYLIFFLKSSISFKILINNLLFIPIITIIFYILIFSLRILFKRIIKDYAKKQ